MICSPAVFSTPPNKSSKLLSLTFGAPCLLPIAKYILRQRLVYPRNPAFGVMLVDAVPSAEVSAACTGMSMISCVLRYTMNVDQSLVIAVLIPRPVPVSHNKILHVSRLQKPCVLLALCASALNAVLFMF